MLGMRRGCSDVCTYCIGEIVEEYLLIVRAK